MRLAIIKRLGLTEVSEVLVIGKDLHWEGRAMEVVVPRFQGPDDGKKFMVMDVVIIFGRGK